jgi:hypothetical protein
MPDVLFEFLCFVVPHFLGVGFIVFMFCIFQAFEAEEGADAEKKKAIR